MYYNTEESPVKPRVVLVEEAAIPGHRITAFHMEAVARENGEGAAEDLDAACHPCMLCGLNYYDPHDAGICNVCDSLYSEPGPEAYMEVRYA